METASIGRGSFTSFLNCLKLLTKSDCTDCDIVGGKIRQSTNNRRCILTIDLSDIIGDVDLMLSDIKLKVQSLDTFGLDDGSGIDSEELTIEFGEKEYHIMDEMSKITFRKPVRKVMDNQFMENDAFNAAVLIDPDKKLFSTTISSYAAKRRIMKLVEAFSADMVVCSLDGYKAKLKIAQDNNENRCVIGDIDLESEIRDKHFRIYHLPFCMDVSSDIEFNAYYINSDDLMLEFKLKMANLIPITIYTKSKIVSNDES